MFASCGDLPTGVCDSFSFVFLFILAIDSPLGDLSRKRLSAQDLFNVRYCFHSSAMLRDELRALHVCVPKFVFYPSVS